MSRSPFGSAARSLRFDRAAHAAISGDRPGRQPYPHGRRAPLGPVVVGDEGHVDRDVIDAGDPRLHRRPPIARTTTRALRFGAGAETPPPEWLTTGPVRSKGWEPAVWLTLKTAATGRAYSTVRGRPDRPTRRTRVA
jgi:hypothetical protein